MKGDKVILKFFSARHLSHALWTNKRTISATSRRLNVEYNRLYFNEMFNNNILRRHFETESISDQTTEVAYLTLGSIRYQAMKTMSSHSKCMINNIQRKTFAIDGFWYVFGRNQFFCYWYVYSQHFREPEEESVLFHSWVPNIVQVLKEYLTFWLRIYAVQVSIF